MEPWDCRKLLCFVHLLKLLFASLILTCLYPYMFVRDRSLMKGSHHREYRTLFEQNFENFKIERYHHLMKIDKLTDHMLLRINAG